MGAESGPPADVGPGPPVPQPSFPQPPEPSCTHGLRVPALQQASRSHAETQIPFSCFPCPKSCIFPSVLPLIVDLHRNSAL